MKLILKTLIFLIIGIEIGKLSLLTTNITSKTSQQIKINNNFYTNSELYVLGDSLSDNGNLPNIINHNLLNLYKIKFQTPFYHNSFSNGDVAASILAKKLGTELIPAWYQNGNNYAVAGAHSKDENDWQYKIFLNNFNIVHQAEKLIKEHKIQKNDYIFIEIGGNDLTTILDKLPSCNSELLIKKSINNEFNAIQKLINAGAYNLIISNSPDISKIPQYVNGSKNTKFIAYNLVKKFNILWKIKSKILIKNNQKINIKLFDLETYFNKILNQAKLMGKNINNESIVWNWKEILLNKKPKYVNNTKPLTINNNFFFDYIHPNKWAHLQIADQLFKLIKN